MGAFNPVRGEAHRRRPLRVMLELNLYLEEHVAQRGCLTNTGRRTQEQAVGDCFR